jgi:hypothetical protein
MHLLLVGVEAIHTLRPLDDGGQEAVDHHICIPIEVVRGVSGRLKVCFEVIKSYVLYLRMGEALHYHY